MTVRRFAWQFTRHYWVWPPDEASAAAMAPSSVCDFCDSHCLCSPCSNAAKKRLQEWCWNAWNVWNRATTRQSFEASWKMWNERFSVGRKSKQWKSNKLCGYGQHGKWEEIEGSGCKTFFSTASCGGNHSHGCPCHIASPCRCIGRPNVRRTSEKWYFACRTGGLELSEVPSMYFSSALLHFCMFAETQALWSRKS